MHSYILKWKSCLPIRTSNGKVSFKVKHFQYQINLPDFPWDKTTTYSVSKSQSDDTFRNQSSLSPVITKTPSGSVGLKPHELDGGKTQNGRVSDGIPRTKLTLSPLCA